MERRKSRAPARLLVQPGVADRQRGLADEALEQLPVLGIEVEGRPPVQREDAEQRVLVDDRHDVRAPEAVLPEPVHREDAPVREDVRDDQRPGGASATQPGSPSSNAMRRRGYVAASRASEKARGSSVRVASSATQSPTAGASISCAAARAISLSTSSRSPTRR